ncbi:dimethylarginine dimethylaminohydrolase family protein [Lysobacter solisilvae (ex Woo and Kim 2020)]|uniref:Dimethylargininase n=1 Tax=Agrilutibacter terrestris TaxID=2865112 RepID=A0A7H0FX30_9GAMM|nr:dimethylargininase [Lysobacter terrestris]QNP40596.1 dimethylargininase [Lysobacter terrestris]
MRIAITREVSPSLGDCQLTHVERTAIDIARADMQHRNYQRVLATLGCKVLALEAEPAMPDAVFVEDVAVVLDEVAVMTRPGAESRRAEGAGVAELLARYRPIRALQAPATLDGGDVLRVGRTLFVGQSGRSNAEGVAQLQDAIAEFGYRVQPVPIRGCLHLKSAVTAPRDDTLLIQPRWVDAASFPGFAIIEVDPGEEHAANVLRLGEVVVMPVCFPRTAQRLRDAGIEVVAVDVSELQKAEGATTCCSIVFDAPDA